MHAANEPNRDPVDPSALKFLLTRYGGVFAERLKVYCGLMQDQVNALQREAAELAAKSNTVRAAPGKEGWGTLPEPSLEYRLRIADELGGSTLAKMAWKKMAKRVAGKVPRG